MSTGLRRPSVGRKLAYAKGSYGLRAPLSSFVEAVPSDLMKLTSCQRCGSGSFDQTGIPFRTTPFVRIQKIAPGSAFRISTARKLGPFLPPSAESP